MNLLADARRTAGQRGWRDVPMWSIVRRVSETGHGDLPLLSVYRDWGVVPREGRTDNHNKASADLSAYQRVMPGDLVLNKMKTWQGSLGVSGHEGIVSPAYIVGRVNTGQVHGPFLHHLLRSAPYIAAYGALSKGIRPQQWDLPWEQFRTLPVLLPPIEEQRRIAALLDDQVARLDHAITLRSKQIILEHERFDAVSESRIEVGRVKRVPLGLLVTAGRPINYGVLMPGPRLDEGIPLVEAGDVMRGPLRIQDLRRTGPDVEGPFRRSRLKSGDLVMAIRGSVGRVQVTPHHDFGILNVTRDAARIAVNPQLALPNYVRHALQSRRAQEWLNLRLTGSAVKGINIADLRKVPISVPGLTEGRPSQNSSMRPSRPSTRSGDSWSAACACSRSASRHWLQRP